MSANPKTITLPVSLSAGVLSACAYMSVGPVCTPDGHCETGVIFSGVICPNGDIAPSAAECDTSLQFSPQDLSDLELIFDATHGITFDSTSGSVDVVIGGGPTLNSQWIVTNGKLILSNPESVGNWIVSNTPGTQTYSVQFDFNDIAIHAPGTSANETIQITTTLEYGGNVVESEVDEYVYYPPPPQAYANIEQIGGGYCNWLITALSSHPAYIFVIERRSIYGGSWSQTYSGVDTCIPRSGAWQYRVVYKDIFGNRGPNSTVVFTNCDGGPLE